MLIGFPFAQGHFQKIEPQHAHHIFCQFASEYYGNSWACSMLFIKYQQVRLDAAVEEVVTAQSITASAFIFFQESSFKTERAKQFQHWFDRYCKHVFLNCMNSYDDYRMNERNMRERLQNISLIESRP
jgi:predicted protein tyrosine phosphatase